MAAPTVQGINIHSDTDPTYSPKVAIPTSDPPVTRQESNLWNALMNPTAFPDDQLSDVFDSQPQQPVQPTKKPQLIIVDDDDSQPQQPTKKPQLITVDDGSDDESRPTTPFADAQVDAGIVEDYLQNIIASHKISLNQKRQLLTKVNKSIKTIFD